MNFEASCGRERRLRHKQHNPGGKGCSVDVHDRPRQRFRVKICCQEIGPGESNQDYERENCGHRPEKPMLVASLCPLDVHAPINGDCIHLRSSCLGNLSPILRRQSWTEPKLIWTW